MHDRADERREDDERQDREAAEIRSSADDHEMKYDGHDDQPGGDAQRVVLDAPGLDLADLAAGALGQRADAVDRAVDDADVEPPQGRARPAADAHEEQVVELVEAPLVERAL